LTQQKISTLIVDSVAMLVMAYCGVLGYFDQEDWSWYRNPAPDGGSVEPFSTAEVGFLVFHSERGCVNEMHTCATPLNNVKKALADFYDQQEENFADNTDKYIDMVIYEHADDQFSEEERFGADNFDRNGVML